MTDRLFAAEQNLAACAKRLGRAKEAVEHGELALAAAERELDAARAEAATLPVVEQAPPGLAVSMAGAAAHDPTVMTQDYT